MKTYNDLHSEIVSLPNLYNAYSKAAKSRKGSEAIEFSKRLHENLWQLYEELLNDTFEHGNYKEFFVSDYKKRKIAAPSFRDHIVHHAVCNYLIPIYDNSFIYDSYACRKNKGTHKGFLRLRKFIRKYSNNSYFLKCDITKYFYSIDHHILLSIVRKKIKDEALISLLGKIISSYNEDFSSTHLENKSSSIQKKGIPIGSLTSQLFANIYLNELDYYVKHELRVKHYIRYVDDFMIISEDKEYLNNLKSKLISFVSKNLILKLEPRKIQMNKLPFGADFLGYVAFKKYARVRTRNYRRFNSRLKQKIHQYYLGSVSFDSINSSFLSYFGHLSYTNSSAIIQKMKNLHFRVTGIKSRAVQRGGNWNNGANAGIFTANLNNAPTNTNNNIGFRCCSEHLADAVSLRRYSQPDAHCLLLSVEAENLRGSMAGNPAAFLMNFKNIQDMKIFDSGGKR